MKIVARRAKSGGGGGNFEEGARIEGERLMKGEGVEKKSRPVESVREMVLLEGRDSSGCYLRVGEGSCESEGEDERKQRVK